MTQVYPERAREPAGSVREFGVRTAGTACLHHPETRDRLDRAHEHGARDALALGHQVEHVMVAVGEVHVRAPGRAVHDAVARGHAPRCCMRPGVVRAEIRLGLHDHASGERAARTAREHLSEKFPRNGDGGPGEECRRQDARRVGLEAAGHALPRLSQDRSTSSGWAFSTSLALVQPRRAVATPHRMWPN